MKSNVSDQLEMMEHIYIDASIKCVADVYDSRDLETIRSRVESQGSSFLTITLPSFCRDFEKSLEKGFVDPTYFKFFKKYGRIPAFLREFLGRLFDYTTGRKLIHENCEESNDIPTLVESVRQICLAYKKIEDSCSPKRTKAALRNFMELEDDFHHFSPEPAAVRQFSDFAAMLWGPLLGDLRLDNMVPRHGPGSTADKISGNRKYRWLVWYDRLENYFPFLGNALSLGAYESKEFEIVRFIPAEQELPVKVITVPKTMKSPRIIASEPVCMQFVQQAIRAALYRALESSQLVGGRISFTDQSINQRLALKSSRDDSFATIDLSDASDRVPLDLALRMFDTNPDLRDAIKACRSTSAMLPDGTLVGPLKKFASMGSALCFPIEAMYFYTICVMAQFKQQHLSVSFANLRKVCKRTYVYGDDIIVPTDQAATVLDYLQKYNCKVNIAKTFVSGSFRESCGMDAYDGYEVTPVYVRRHFPEGWHQAKELISLVSTASSFYLKGYWRTASFCYAMAEKISGPLPWVSDDSEGLGRISFLGLRSSERWNYKYHRLEVKAVVPRSVYRSDMVDGYSALSKSLRGLELLSQEEVLRRDRWHLERSALFGAVALQRRWVPAS
jgi:hypothetical protein